MWPRSTNSFLYLVALLTLSLSAARGAVQLRFDDQGRGAWARDKEGAALEGVRGGARDAQSRTKMPAFLRLERAKPPQRIQHTTRSSPSFWTGGQTFWAALPEQVLQR